MNNKSYSGKILITAILSAILLLVFNHGAYAALRAGVRPLPAGGEGHRPPRAPRLRHGGHAGGALQGADRRSPLPAAGVHRQERGELQRHHHEGGQHHRWTRIQRDLTAGSPATSY